MFSFVPPLLISLINAAEEQPLSRAIAAELFLSGRAHNERTANLGIQAGPSYN
jgi:hypothetical protein